MGQPVKDILSVLWFVVLMVGASYQFIAAFRGGMAKDWFGGIAVLILAYKHLIAHSERANLFVQRLLLHAFNASTEWSLDVRLKLHDDSQSPEEVCHKFRDLLTNEKASTLEGLRTKGKTEFSFRLAREFAADVAVFSSDDGVTLSIRILDMNVPYRDSQKRIEKSIVPFFEFVEQHLHLAPTGRVYSLSSYFPGGNPFFGVFVQKLNIAKVDSFKLTIRSESPDRVLSVQKDRVELTAKTLNSFQSHAVSTFRLGIGAT